MPFSVIIENNKVISRGRPSFSNKTNKDIQVISGLEDRRHILHGAIMITKVLVDSFNRILVKEKEEGLTKIVTGIRNNLKTKNYRLSIDESLLQDKIKELITIAFGKPTNLVAGFAVENQGIEKARQAISLIKKGLNQYPSFEVDNFDINNFEEFRFTALQLIDSNLHKEKTGKVVLYKEWILKILKESIENAPNQLETIDLLDDFEFSCTLDILHENTSKEQNIRGLSMANRLYTAIFNQNEEEIYSILLYE